MAKISVYYQKNKTELEFEAPEKISVLLTRLGIPMVYPCYGRGICGKCRIELSGAASEPDEKEVKYGTRLACRAIAEGDVSVTIPESGEILVEGANAAGEGSTLPEESGHFRAAVDIGTTTLVVHILNEEGKIVAAKGMLNPQEVIAADVMGRIGAAIEGKLKELSQMIRAGILKLVEELGYAGKIEYYVITGNTTMLYLFEAEDPVTLSAFPFEADDLFGRTVLFDGVTAELPVCMHAFVGADITTAVLNSKMTEKKETSLLCDVGTNGEIALWHEGKLYITSTAAGPAFEGAGISSGSQGIPGAIEKVEISDGKFIVKTIGDREPESICGSGLIDAVSAALSAELIDETGAVDEDIVLSEKVKLTQKDIRSVQLAKAAVCAGILTVSEVSGVPLDQIDTFYIAGGFGAHLNVESACAIGLFPKEVEKKAVILGNAALAGAEELLLHSELRTKIENIKNAAVHVNLGGDSSFNDYYIEQMMF